jgi:hypothetical protein
MREEEINGVNGFTVNGLSGFSRCENWRIKANTKARDAYASSISLLIPHPNPLPQGERRLRKFSPSLDGRGEGEGDYVNLFDTFVILKF